MNPVIIANLLNLTLFASFTKDYRTVFMLQIKFWKITDGKDTFNVQNDYTVSMKFPWEKLCWDLYRWILMPDWQNE